MTSSAATDLHDDPTRVAYNEHNDCGVRSVVAACAPRFDYATVHRVFEFCERKYRRGVHNWQLEHALTVLRIDYRRLTLPRAHRFDTRTFAANWPRGAFVVGVKHHFTTLRDGVYFDFVETIDPPVRVKRAWLILE